MTTTMAGLAAAANAAGNIDWGSCLIIAMPILLVIWVLRRGSGPRHAPSGRIGGILMIVGGLVLCALVVH